METKSKELTKEARYYNSINKLPLANFVDCLCDNDFNALVIQGEPSAIELVEAWAKILDEYNDLLGQSNDEYKQYYSNYKNLARLKSKQYKILMLAEVMDKIGYVDAFASHLRKLLNKPNLKFDITKPEQYSRDLKTCFAMVKGLNIQIFMIESELETISVRMDNASEAPKRDDFINTLITLSDFAKRELDPETITVYSYCVRINRLNEYTRKQQSKKR